MFPKPHLASTVSKNGSDYIFKYHCNITLMEKTEINGRGNLLRQPHDTPLHANVDTNIADKSRPIGRWLVIFCNITFILHHSSWRYVIFLLRN
jgi:hypothetical protein